MIKFVVVPIRGGTEVYIIKRTSSRDINSNNVTKKGFS